MYNNDLTPSAVAHRAGEPGRYRATLSGRPTMGLNDELGVLTIPGTCGTCHDSPNVGNHSVPAPLDIPGHPELTLQLD